jgi:hypothetical protein
MPLSNDFTNTRLSYLKDSIKNTNTVAQQFYPRFVREYNEQFPYTEEKMSNIENPISNTRVKGYLQEKTVGEVVDDLTTKIMSLTNDEEVTKYIGRELAKELSLPILSYLNDNFDSIQKKILIPRDGISKDAFVNKVLGVLRTDTYKNDISVLDNEPLIPTPQQNSFKQLGNQSSVLRQTILPKPLALTGIYRPSGNKFGATNPLPLAQKKGRPRGIPNKASRNFDISDEDLKLLNFHPEVGKGNYNDTDEDFEKFKKAYMKGAPPVKKLPAFSPPVTVSFPSGFLSPPRKRQSPAPPPLDTAPITAPTVKIIKGKKKTGGRGIQLEPLKFQHRVIKHKQVFNNNKYAIDTKKLKKNILDLKYVKNANHVATFQPIEISNNLKNIIENIIKDHYNLQTDQFNDLTSTELRILKRLFKFLNIHDAPLETNSKENDSIQQKFEVAYASFLAGNDNKELIKELSQYVKLALHENTISKKDGYEILKKLNK